MNKKRIENIDILRGIMIIIMIMGHIGFSKPFDKYIHTFHMPIWFFISGFLWKRSSRKEYEIILFKIKKLLIPYFFTGLTQYLFWILISYKNSNVNILEPIKNLFWMNTNLIMPIAGALWFLTALFFSETIYILLNKIIDNKKKSIIVVLISGIGCCLNKYFNIRLPWALDCALVGVGFMHAGYLCKENVDNVKLKKLLNLDPIALFSILILNIIMCLINGYVNMRTGEYGIIPLFWINSFTSIMLYWNISNLLTQYSHNIKTIKCSIAIIKRIGMNSIIYLCYNQLIILIISKGVAKTFLSNYHWIYERICIFALAVPLLYCIDCIISKTRLSRIYGTRRSSICH